MAVHQKSFIARRSLANGDAVGPEAVFGRYNMSINMTRSIGDRWGPRSVVAVPDVTAITIPRDQFARFILCSDGVWDVMVTEEMRLKAFDCFSPEEMAVTTAYEAQNRRITRRMRQDDISVIVVDLNPHLFPRKNSFSCRCSLS